MRHFFGSTATLALAISGLTSGVIATAAGRLLVAAAGHAKRLAAGCSATATAAVPLAAVAVRTNRRKPAAGRAVDLPVVLADRRPRLPRGWIAEGIPAILELLAT